MDSFSNFRYDFQVRVWQDDCSSLSIAELFKEIGYIFNDFHRLRLWQGLTFWLSYLENRPRKSCDWKKLFIPEPKVAATLFSKRPKIPPFAEHHIVINIKNR